MSSGTDGALAPIADAPNERLPVTFGFDLAAGFETVVEATWRDGKIVMLRQLWPPASKVAEGSGEAASDHPA
jgi:hypothetical protein